MNRSISIPLAIISALGVTACGVTPTVTNVSPARGSTYVLLGTVDSATGTDPSPVCTGTPVPPVTNVPAWWAGIDTQTRNQVVVTGFELWSNTLPSCLNARHDVYRGHFVYDLAQLRALDQPNSPVATRINSATMRLTIQGGVNDRATTTLRCFNLAGGVTAINLLAPGTTILTGLNQVNATAAFPPTVKRIEQIIPLPSPLPGTIGPLTFSPGGAGLLIVDVDLRDEVMGALNRGDAAIGFSLISVAEARPTVTGDEMLDCRTFVTPGVLEVKSL